MKKYVAKWKSKKIVLNPDDYKILLERFDLSNFVKETSHRRHGPSLGKPVSYLTNSISCPLCKTYLDNNCRGCPFDIHSSPASCVSLIREALKRTIREPFDNMDIYENELKIVYDIEEGKRVVALIRELLITKFKVVEE